MKLQQWVKAKDACDKLLAIDKDNVKVWFRVASPADPFFFWIVLLQNACSANRDVKS